jgi:hypothetical protein
MALNQVLLSTAIIQLCNKNEQTANCRALLDLRSATSFITKECVQRPDLNKKTKVNTVGVSCKEVARSHNRTITERRKYGRGEKG